MDIKEVLGLAARLAIWLVICGAAIAAALALARRLRPAVLDLGTARLAILGGIGMAVFVPLLMQFFNVLSGDGLVPWRFVLDDSVWAAVVGAVGTVATVRYLRRAPPR